MVNNNDEHSKEVREIMGQQANWMVRWGAALLGLIVATAAGAFFLISYPVFVTVPFKVETTITGSSSKGVAGEAILSDLVYDQVAAGQEVKVMVNSSLPADRTIIGYVDAKLRDRRIRLIFPTEPGRKRKLRTTLQDASSVKIKTGKKRLITQFNGIFLPK